MTNHWPSESFFQVATPRLIQVLACHSSSYKARTTRGASAFGLCWSGVIYCCMVFWYNTGLLIEYSSIRRHTQPGGWSTLQVFTPWPLNNWYDISESLPQTAHYIWGNWRKVLSLYVYILELSLFRSAAMCLYTMSLQYAPLHCLNFRIYVYFFCFLQHSFIHLFSPLKNSKGKFFNSAVSIHSDLFTGRVSFTPQMSNL